MPTLLTPRDGNPIASTSTRLETIRPDKYGCPFKCQYLLGSTNTIDPGAVDQDSWRDERSRMGHLLESFVVQQVISQSGWTDADVQFHHYRDKDQLEVDLVITQGKNTWGIEVKAASSVSTRDISGLKRLADICGKGFRGGVVLYNGDDILRLGDDMYMALPVSELWNR